MKPTTAILAAALAALAAPAGAISKDELKRALDKNPEVLLDVLRANKKAVFEIVSQAAQEEQKRRYQDEQEREKKDFEESFKNPKSPDLSKARYRGSADASLTLVEYSDFQCPYCARGFQTVEALRKKHGDKLRFVFKHLPLPMHPQALPAAQFMEAAALQSEEKAWSFHDLCFQNQDKLGDEFFEKSAKDLGLNWKKLKADAQSEGVKKRIDADVSEANAFGFSGTPAFLLNGVPVRGAYPLDHFDMIIKRLESKTAKKDDGAKEEKKKD
jgi:protein-disulfide isomerase